MSSYQTSVYHFNVGVGDCSLILVRETNQTLRGILIDGSLNAWNTIKKNLLDIQQTYSDLVLTTIIITHYDQDHLQGIYDLLIDVVNKDAQTMGLLPKRLGSSGVDPQVPGTPDPRVQIYDTGSYNTFTDVDSTNIARNYSKLMGDYLPHRTVGNINAATIASFDADYEVKATWITRFFKRMFSLESTLGMFAQAGVKAPIFLGRDLMWGGTHVGLLSSR